MDAVTMLGLWSSWLAMHDERRTRPRHTLLITALFQVSVLISPEGSNGRTDGEALTVNVSDGGLCFLTDVPLAEGDVLMLRLPVPQELSFVPSLVDVCWVRLLPVWQDERYAVGVRFML